MASPERGQPSVAAIATATAIISFLFGYYIGQARSIGLFGGSFNPLPSAKIGASQRKGEEDSDISDADSQSGDDIGELKDFAGHEECKLVLVVRTDLGMTRGRSRNFSSKTPFPF